jgi:hypothetical protein
LTTVSQQGVKEGITFSPVLYIVCISIGRREQGRPNLRWEGTLCFGMDIYKPIFVADEGKYKSGN